MSTQIAGFILRAKDRYLTVSFYNSLGLNTNEHQHDGPQHHEMDPLAHECVAEIYAWSESFPHDALMLNVDSIIAALEIAAKYGIKPKSALRETPDMRFIYIEDPDGRSVMLIEK